MDLLLFQTEVLQVRRGHSAIRGVPEDRNRRRDGRQISHRTSGAFLRPHRLRVQGRHRPARGRSGLILEGTDPGYHTLLVYRLPGRAANPEVVYGFQIHPRIQVEENLQEVLVDEVPPLKDRRMDTDVQVAAESHPAMDRTVEASPVAAFRSTPD